MAEIKETGRVLYIEPNYDSSQEMVSESGMEQYEMIPHYEDYSIFVNLEVEVRGRSIRTSNETGTLVMSWRSDDKSSVVNFMSGSKIPTNNSNGYINSLTTNYTNTFIKDLKKDSNDRWVSDPTVEMFGISSIDISYSNYMVPEVTINFVDIRGISLFAQEEFGRDSQGNATNDIAGSFFKCFFTFPYPKFTLFVKGFYGEPVAYELTCSDFRARFDSNTGNFGATAKFVGFAFSFFGDVSLRAIMAAPYSDYIGSEYWNSKVASGEFFVLDENNQKMEMPRFGELVDHIKEITEEADRLAENDPAMQEKNVSEKKSSLASQIQNKFATYCSVIRTAVVGSKAFENVYGVKGLNGIIYSSNSFEDTWPSCVFLHQNEDSKTFAEIVGDNNKLIETAYNNLVTAINEYNQMTNASLPIPTNIANDEGNTVIFAKKTTNSDNGSTTTVYIDENLEKLLIKNEDGEHNRKTLYDRLVAYKNGYSKNFLKEDEKFNEIRGFVFLDAPWQHVGLNIALQRETNKNAVDMENAVIKVDDAVDQAISKSLGYPPTIENITRMIMAHFETFAYMTFKTGESISSNPETRTMNALGVSLNDISDVNDKFGAPDFVPPFPKVVHTITEMGESKLEDSWVGDYSGDFLEKDLVHGLLNGTIEFSKLQELSKQKTPTGGSNAPLRAVMKMPIMPYDFIATKQPYTDMGNFVNLNEMAAQLAYRAFALIGVSNIGGGESGRFISPEVLGDLEAYNFHQQFPKPVGALQGVIGDDQFVNNILNILTTKNSSMPWGDELFLVKSTNNNTMYALNGHAVVSTNGGKAFIPMQALSSRKCAYAKKIAASGKILKSLYSDPEYCVTRASQTTDEGSNFSVNACYIEKNPARFQSIFENHYSIDDQHVDKLKNIYHNVKIEQNYIASFFEKKDYFRGYFNGKDIIPSSGNCMFPASTGVTCAKNVFENNKPYLTPLGDDFKGVQRIGTQEELFGSYCNDLVTNKLSIVKLETFGDSRYYELKTDYDRAAFFLEEAVKIFKYENIVKEYIASSLGEMAVTLLPYTVVLYVGSLVSKHGTAGTTEIEGVNQLSFSTKLKLKKEFESWVVNFYVPEIHNNLAIVDSLEGYNKLVPNNSTNSHTFVDDGKNEILGGKSVIEHFSEYTRASFFENYLSVAANVYIGEKNGGYKRIELMFRPGGKGSVKLTQFLLSFVGYVKPMKVDMGDGYINIDESKLKAFLDSFKNGLSKLYREDDTTNTTVDEKIDRAKEPENISKDIKVALYKYCKMLYDKWVGGITPDEFNSVWTCNRFFGDTDLGSKYFYFIDEYYSSAGDLFLNIGEICECINNSWSQDDYSLLSFITDIYAKNRFQFFCVQNFMDYSDRDRLKRMFTPVPVNEMRNPNRMCNFIAMFASEKSSNLDYGDRSEYKNDSFLVDRESGQNGNNWPKQLLSRDAGTNTGYMIPAFGVSYGKMYQNYFKKIDIGMENPIVTEQSLRATYEIASMASGETSPRASTTVGEDLFTVYSNNSYTCNIEMMGCAWVQPLMYFVLSNVPMFRGTYLIEKVTHSIQPNYMTTKFMGVRMSNIRTRKTSTWLQRKKANQVGVQGNEGYLSAENMAADLENDCPYPYYPIIQDYSDVQNCDCLKKITDWSKERLSLGVDYAKHLMSKGLSKETAAGIVGHCYQESRWDPQKLGKDTGGICSGGLTQWYNWGLACMINLDVKNHVTNGPNKKKYKGWRWSNRSQVPKRPDAYQQLDYIVACLEYSPSFHHTKDLKAAATPEQAAKIFFDYTGRGVLSVSHMDVRQCVARTVYEALGGKAGSSANSAPKALNDNTNKISEFAMGFYNAVRQSSDNSSVKVEFGVSEEKSNGLTLYLTNGKKSGDFGKIFDIILSVDEYYQHVKMLKWVTTENSLKSTPTAIVVELSEAPVSSGKRVGISLDDGKSLMSTGNLSYKDISETFCKAVAKKFKDTKIDAVKQTVPGISDIEEMISAYTITPCSEIVKTSAGLNGTYERPKTGNRKSLAAYLGFSSATPSQEEQERALVTLHLTGYKGRTLRVHKKLAQEIDAIFKDLSALGVEINQNVSCWAPRNVSGTNTISVHAYGAAIDLNFDLNPQLKPGKYNKTIAAYPDDVKRGIVRTESNPIVQVFYKYGWGWGGNFRTTPVDYMHFSKNGC